MPMQLYIDESGDLGWTFSKPFKKGGSSRHLTIAFLLIPKAKSHLPKRIVKDVYSQRYQLPSIELKGSQLKLPEKIYFAQRVADLLKQEPSIRIFSITVKKSRVKQHIRQDPNKLYNYMIGLILPDQIKNHPTVAIFPDQRSIKVQSGNTLEDYLQIKLWFEVGAKTTIKVKPRESKYALNLQFVDFVSNIIWYRYEHDKDKVFKLLPKKVKSVQLFF